MASPVTYKVVDQHWVPNDPAAAETALNTLGGSNWQLLTVYLDSRRERTRWVFSQGSAPVTYKVIDQQWSPSDPVPTETMLNTTGQASWQLVTASPDPQRDKTRWIFSHT